MNTTHEEWRPVAGWEGLYEVSDQGRVRSLDRRVAFGEQTRLVKGRVLKHGLNMHGQPFVNMTNGERRKVRLIHQLVLEAFVGPKPPGMVCCHWNDVKTDNRLENLRWDTQTANMYDAVRNGRNHQALKTRCAAGHEFTPENTRIGKSGGRWCRECHRIEGRARYNADLENNRIKSRDSMRRRRQAKREAGRQ